MYNIDFAKTLTEQMFFNFLIGEEVDSWQRENTVLVRIFQRNRTYKVDGWIDDRWMDR